MDRKTTKQEAVEKPETGLKNRLEVMNLDQLWSIFSKSPIPTLIRDTESRLNVLYNDAMKALTGYAQHEVQDIETWVKKIYPDPKLQLRVADIISCTSQRQLIIRGDEFIITRKDGGRRNIEFSIYNLVHKKQQTFYQLLQGMDVTSRRIAERELKRLNQDLASLNQELENRVKERTIELEESQTRLQMALEGAKEGLWVIDFVGGKMNFSSHSAKMLGYDLDDLGTTSTKWDKITHPEDWPKVEKALKKHFSGVIPYYEQQYRARTKDGRWKWILGHGRVTKRNEAGEPIQAIGTHVDITNLKRTEIQLSKSERKFKLLVENAPFGLLILNKKQKIEYFNPKFHNLFGYTAEELPDLESWLVKAYPEKAYRQNVSNIWKVIFRKIKINETVEPHELTVRCKDGKEKIIHFNHVPLRSNKLLVSYEDVTARTLAERSLKNREVELKINNEKLEEMNNALRVLLQRIEKDKSELEEKVMFNMKDLVIPYLTSLEKTRLSSRQKNLIDILKSNLSDIVSPFSRKLSASHLYLTPKEVQVANLVKEDNSTKEISLLLNMSESSVQFHRHNIRKKLGLIDKKINLQSFLQSLNYNK